MLKTFVPWFDPLVRMEAAFWDQLKDVPPDFVLYGQTARAVRGEHTPGNGFDLRSALPLDVPSLEARLPFLAEGTKEQNGPQSVTYTIDRSGWGRHNITFFSFSGDRPLKYVLPPERCKDNGLTVASHLDLAAELLIGASQELGKGAFDATLALHHELTEIGVAKLEDILGAAQALAPSEFKSQEVVKILQKLDKGQSAESGLWWLSDIARTAREIGPIPLLEAYDSHTDWLEMLSPNFPIGAQRGLAEKMVARIDDFHRNAEEPAYRDDLGDDYDDPVQRARSLPRQLRITLNRVIEDLKNNHMAVSVRGIARHAIHHTIAELAEQCQWEGFKVRFVNDAEKRTIEEISALVEDSHYCDTRLIFLANSGHESASSGLSVLEAYSTMPAHKIGKQMFYSVAREQEPNQPVVQIEGPEPGD